MCSLAASKLPGHRSVALVQEFQEVPIEQPTINLQQSAEVQPVSSDRIRCTSLRVTQSSSITCAFASSYLCLEGASSGLSPGENVLWEAASDCQLAVVLTLLLLECIW